MLHTVEKLSEAMAHEADQDRPRPDYSLKDYKDPGHEEAVDDHRGDVAKETSPSGAPAVDDEEDAGKREGQEDEGEEEGGDDGEKGEEGEMDEETERREGADLERYVHCLFHCD